MAQEETVSSYLSIDDTSNFLSSYDFPVQIARILPKRSCSLQAFKIHLSGESGSCKIHVYGHEGGHFLPTLAQDLIEPIAFVKRNDRDTIFTFTLSDPLRIENDQFYIALDDFDGDFGVKQDQSYKTEFCISGNGGTYYPTYVLSRKFSKFIGQDDHMAMDITLNYDSEVMPFYTDVTEAVGLPSDLYNYTSSWADVNNDFWPDLLLGHRLYINKGGSFEQMKYRPAWASNNQLKRSAFIDMNNDGFWDIILFGGANTLLYVNDGKGNFNRIRLNIPSMPHMNAFSIADINHDQYPDLFVAQLWSEYPIPQPNFLFLNDGNLGFTNASSRLYPSSDESFNFPQGIASNKKVRSSKIPDKNKNRRSRASQFIDYDQDGDQDLYVANYFVEKDEFYQNDGQGFFSVIEPPHPIGQDEMISNNATGVAWEDFDNDGDFDILVPQLAHPRNILKYDHRGITLYENNNGSFTDISSISGIHFEETHAGAGFGDINNDGLLDLITTVYYGCRFVDMYLQQQDHTFKISTDQSGFSKLATGSEVDFVDYNNDGKLDVVFAREGNFYLFENIRESNNNWLKINLNCKSRNHFGLGSIVKVYTQDNIYTQQVGAGSGQGVQSPSTLHFGLGQAQRVDKVELWYGDKLISVGENLSVNRTYLLDEEFVKTE